MDFFPMLHTAATEMVENAAPADLARMPEVTPMSIGGCTALPNSGVGAARRLHGLRVTNAAHGERLDPDQLLSEVRRRSH